MALIKSISGIRGTIGGAPEQNLTPVDIVAFTSAYHTFLSKKNDAKKLQIVVGRDGRISGPLVSQMVCATLQFLGADVLDLGLSTTPTVEMEVQHSEADGGIIITASHNPMEWNALKLLNANGEFLSATEAAELLEYAKNQDYTYAPIQKVGTYQHDSEAIAKHIDHILALDLVDVEAIQEAQFTVALDAINSTGSISISPLLEKLGVTKIAMINGDCTGHFAHNPEPLPQNLAELSSVINRERYHLGIAVDPDVDRLVLFDENGDCFGEEYTLVAVADYVLSHKKGNVVSNLSSSRALRDIAQKHGVEYAASAVGEVNVVAKMKEIGAVIGGEGNGGVILPELHYGRDALLGVALLLSFMAKSKKTASQLRAQYPNYFMSKSKIELEPSMDVAKICDLIAQKYAAEKVDRTDGVKIDFEDYWVHLRASGTEPIIRIYSEASSMAMAENISKKLFSDISEIRKELL